MVKALDPVRPGFIGVCFSYIFQVHSSSILNYYLYTYDLKWAATLSVPVRRSQGGFTRHYLLSLRRDPLVGVWLNLVDLLIHV